MQVAVKLYRRTYFLECLLQSDIVVHQTRITGGMEFIVGCGVMHYTFRICPISLAAVAVDSCPIWLDTASYEILYPCFRSLPTFHMHIRIRLRSHLSMATSDDFISAYLKYDTHPRMTWYSATFLRSYPIPLLLPVSIFSFAFSLSKLFGWTRNLHPSPVL